MCGVPLAAHQTWPGAPYRCCGASACASKVRKLPGGLYVAAHERKCDASGCQNFVPEGRYRIRSAVCCSLECWESVQRRGTVRLVCACGCGQEFFRQRKPRHRRSFISLQHEGDYVRNKYLEEACGGFRTILEEYLVILGATNYRSTDGVRSRLGSFFRFLNERKIESLDDVTPTTITQFVAWSKAAGPGDMPGKVSSVSKFFRWLIAEGRRETGNPVVPLIHARRRERRAPRPLENTELQFTWKLLGERGNARLRLATAIGEEAGLRIGEICRIRLSDIDLIRQRILVRLPNKTNRERWAFFDEKTKRYYTEWMAERDPGCGHDYLLHNTRTRRPMTVGSLTAEFNRTLCKVASRRRIRNQTGFDRWSTHRLRHTMASNLVSAGADVATVMEAGGWRSYEAMAGYARVDLDVARRGYDEAMRGENIAHSNHTCTISPSELLARRRGSQRYQPSSPEERCV